MIFEYESYIKYLKAYLKALPKHGHGEARKMAAHLGVSSTYMSHILSGAKNLSAEQTELLSEYLGHSSLEAEYFFYLAQLERAGTQRLKKFCQTKLNELKNKSLKLSERLQPVHNMSDEEKSVFYSMPIYSAIHLYTSTGKNGRTLDEISRRFEISRSKTAKFMEMLVAARLVIEKENQYTMGTQSTHLEAQSPHLYKHHANWRFKAIQASEDLGESELMYTVNVSLSKKDFEHLREEMIETIKKFLKQVHESPAEEIACFNLDWFWIRK